MPRPRPGCARPSFASTSDSAAIQMAAISAASSSSSFRAATRRSAIPWPPRGPPRARARPHARARFTELGVAARRRTRPGTIATSTGRHRSLGFVREGQRAGRSERMLLIHIGKTMRRCPPFMVGVRAIRPAPPSVRGDERGLDVLVSSWLNDQLRLPGHVPVEAQRRVGSAPDRPEETGGAAPARRPRPRTSAPGGLALDRHRTCARPGSGLDARRRRRVLAARAARRVPPPRRGGSRSWTAPRRAALESTGPACVGLALARPLLLGLERERWDLARPAIGPPGPRR